MRQSAPARVLRHAFADAIPDPEVELRVDISLLGREPVPAHRFGLVLSHAPAVGVPDPEAELCVRVALLGSCSQFSYGYRLLLRVEANLGSEGTDKAQDGDDGACVVNRHIGLSG